MVVPCLAAGDGAQCDADAHSSGAAQDGQGDFVAGLVLVEQAGQGVKLVNLATAYGANDVSFLEAGLVGRAAGQNRRVGRIVARSDEGAILDA